MLTAKILMGVKYLILKLWIILYHIVLVAYVPGILGIAELLRSGRSTSIFRRTRLECHRVVTSSVGGIAGGGGNLSGLALS